MISFSCPLLLCSMGALFSDYAGILAIFLEGLICFSAYLMFFFILIYIFALGKQCWNILLQVRKLSLYLQPNISVAIPSALCENLASLNIYKVGRCSCVPASTHCFSIYIWAMREPSLRIGKMGAGFFYCPIPKQYGTQRKPKSWKRVGAWATRSCARHGFRALKNEENTWNNYHHPWFWHWRIYRSGRFNDSWRDYKHRRACCWS